MRKSLSQPLSPTTRPNSARYWRTRYAQLQSDFEELLFVNQTLARRNAALEGMIKIFPESINPESCYRRYHRRSKSLFHQPTTTTKTTKGKKS